MKKGDYIHRSSNHEYETNFYRVINLFQYFDAHDPTRSIQQQLTNYRDSYMASNFKNFVQQNPDIKIVLWAHNGHISKYPIKIKLLGGLLNEAYGSAYFPMSFAFNKGSFQSIELKNGKTNGLKEFTVTEAKDGTFDWYLAQAKKDNFILNFRQKNLPTDLTNFVGNSFRTRIFGSLLSREFFNERYLSTIVGKDFDAVIFINTTTRSRPTPTGMR